MVFVAVTIAVLLAMTAFAFDFARIWAEQRELQSGADAAALAVAEDCAQDKCDPGYDAEGLAEEYADANAKDAAAWVPLVDIDLAAQQVTVQTATETTDGDNQFDMTFAGAIGFDGLTVTSDATVAWGSPAGLATLPIIFSQCEWESFGEPGFVEDGGFLHHGSSVLNGELPPATGYAVPGPLHDDLLPRRRGTVPRVPQRPGSPGRLRLARRDHRLPGGDPGRGLGERRHRVVAIERLLGRLPA